MASRTDIILDLRAGFTVEQIANRHKTDLRYVQIVAGAEPDSASNRRRKAGKPVGRIIPFRERHVVSRIAPPILWHITCPLGRIAKAA